VKFSARIVEDPSKPKENSSVVRLMCMSDTHGFHQNIPKEQIFPSDLLIFAGDFSLWGNPKEVASAKEFMLSLPVQKRIVVSGNLDLCFDTKNLESFGKFLEQFQFPDEEMKVAKEKFLDGGHFIYLEHESAEVDGIKIFGSPYTPTFGDFGFPTTKETAPATWAVVPEGTDIIICHGPPHDACDRTSSGFKAGCPELRKAVERVKPALTVFGHIHEAYGQTKIGDTLCCNVALVNSERIITNPPTYIDLVPLE
jgi:Icc-related predicted phosphoesterase